MKMACCVKMSAQNNNKAFVDLGHHCEMSADEDEIETRIPGNSFWFKIKKNWIRNILVNEKICKSCAIHLRSHGAIEKEKRRHLAHFLSSIHPFSNMAIWWRFLMMFVSLTQLILVPLDVAYFSFDNLPFFSSNMFIIMRMFTDLICCTHIIINSITGFYDESKKIIILNRKKIFKHYLKTTFTIDLLSALPTHWDLFIDMKHSRYGLYALLTLQTISLLKYLHFYALIKNETELANICNVDFYIRHGIVTILILLLYWHAVCCTQLFINVLCFDELKITLYNSFGPFQAFSRTIYDGALVIYTSSYGVKNPQSNHEYLTIIGFWFLSKFVQIFLLARFIEFLRAYTSPQLKYSQIVKQLVEFMRHKQLPLYTQRRILAYYEFRFQNCYFKENEIYSTISGQLRQEITMQTCKQLVENVEFFKDLPLNLLTRIVSCLRSEIYLTNDVVLKAGTPGSCMYFVSTGAVAVYTISGKEVCHLDEGAHFGEIALVNPNAVRVATVIAVEMCELYRLDKKEFVKVIRPYPDLLEKMQKIAVERMERTDLLEEHYKTELITNRMT